MNESYLNYDYEYLDPASDWFFITPTISSSELMLVPQECGRLIIRGKHHTERGPLDSYQITYSEKSITGKICLNGKNYSYPMTDEIMFLDCRRGYYMETQGDTIGMFIHFNGGPAAHYMDLFNKYNGGDPVLHQSSRFVKERLQELLKYYKYPGSSILDYRAEMLINEMIVDIVRRVMPDRTEDYGEYVEKTISYINSHYAESLTLDSISESVHVSKYYLCHIFKQETGVSPINYLQQIRVSKAKELLRLTDMSQEAICGKVGLYNCSYLSKLFRYYEGITPNEYRKNWK